MSTNTVMSASFAVLELMPPKMPFYAGELLATAKQNNNEVFPNVGSCNKLISVANDTNSAPISLTSKKVRVYSKSGKSWAQRTEYKYSIRPKGQRMIDDGKIVPLWRP